MMRLILALPLLVALGCGDPTVCVEVCAPRSVQRADPVILHARCECSLYSVALPSRESAE